PTEDTDTGSVHFPIPDETIADAALADSDLEPVAAETTWESDDDDAVIQTDLEPIGTAETPVADTAPAPHPDTEAGDDPYATAPDWVRAHIPRGPLVISQRSRGGLKSAIGRSRAPRRAPAAPDLVEQTAAAPVTDTAAAAATPAKPGDDRSRTWMLVGGGIAALAAMSAVVVNVMSTGTDEPEAPLPPVTAVASSSATPTTTEAVAAPAWCAPVTEPDRIVRNGPGGRDSGPAVIQALGH